MIRGEAAPINNIGTINNRDDAMMTDDSSPNLTASGPKRLLIRGMQLIHMAAMRSMPASREVLFDLKLIFPPKK
jgi:hypothetical protein